MPTAIIADDERLMRDQLRMRLGQVWPELEIVGEAKNGDEAIALVAQLKPDLTFLDIRMPGKTGMEAARQIGAQSNIVFVTAYDQYAVEAFERGALDYVLKPPEQSACRSPSSAQGAPGPQGGWRSTTASPRCCRNWPKMAAPAGLTRNGSRPASARTCA
jgi:DNA-binding LytR/AlgR family response regulator